MAKKSQTPEPIAYCSIEVFDNKIIVKMTNAAYWTPNNIQKSFRNVIIERDKLQVMAVQEQRKLEFELSPPLTPEEKRLSGLQTPIKQNSDEAKNV